MNAEEAQDSSQNRGHSTCDCHWRRARELMIVQGGSRGEGSWIKPESISTDGSLQRMAEIIRAMGPDASTMDVIGLESVGPKGEGQDELPPRPSVREYRRDGRVVTETTQ